MKYTISELHRKMQDIAPIQNNKYMTYADYKHTLEMMRDIFEDLYTPWYKKLLRKFHGVR